jgi:hypothetical protein
VSAHQQQVSNRVVVMTAAGPVAVDLTAVVHAAPPDGEARDLVALSKPGREVPMANGTEWLVLRRTWTPAPDGDSGVLTVELVRPGSAADPRGSTPDPDTDPEGA